MPVTLLDPQGQARTIPDDQVQAALAAGGKRALKMTDPQGTPRWIPEDQKDAALQAGGKLAESGPDTRSLFQKAKDNFNANTQGSQPGEHGVKAFIADVGQGGGDFVRSVAHPLDTLASMGQMIAHPLDTTHAEVNALYENPSKFIGNAIGNVGAGTIVGEMASPITSRAVGAVKAAPEAYRGARSAVIGGSKLDELIPGDTVTPRQRYNTAKAQGVNLDTAQATNSPVAMGAKRVTEHSLVGSSKFEANNAANVEALHAHSEKLLNDATPVDMSREDFGNQAKKALANHQQELNATAGDIYKKLDADIGTTRPDASSIKEAAQAIVKENKGYYTDHPEMLNQGAARAWKIVNSLADAKTADTWSNLHKLRSDMLDLTRSPDMTADRPIGWMKQLTGAVDETMTKGADIANRQDFREANEIYKWMKSTYDDPTSKLYHVVRSQDGLTAANTLASITPEIARKIGAAAPELLPQLQRQTMNRLLRPTGNELPDLKNLGARLSRAQKEQLAGVLTPEQIQSLDELGRTSKLVTFDANPSGSGKLAQKATEAGVLGSGLTRIAGGILTGNPAAVVEGAAPLAVGGAQRIAASKLTNPAFTEKIMSGRMIKPRPGESMVDYLARKKAAKP
jgi:hypothetical protein